jgi:hypothetical protein
MAVPNFRRRNVHAKPLVVVDRRTRWKEKDKDSWQKDEDGRRRRKGGKEVREGKGKEGRKAGKKDGRKEGRKEGREGRQDRKEIIRRKFGGREEETKDRSMDGRKEGRKEGRKVEPRFHGKVHHTPWGWKCPFVGSKEVRK